MFKTLFLVLGLFAVIFGTYRLVTSLLALSLPPRHAKQFQIIPEDATMAGRFLEFCVVVFSVYMVLNGLHTIGYIRGNSIFSHESTKYIAYVSIATVLIAFYSIVVFTNWKIDKVSANAKSYRLDGLGAGVWYLLFMFCMIFAVSAWKKRWTALPFAGVAIVVVASVAGYIEVLKVSSSVFLPLVDSLASVFS